MKKFFLLFVTLSLCYFVTPAQAVFDPLAVPNNRVGVHILDPQEIHQAAKLVNSSGGSWGYVTIPIRSNDRDREKWIRFLITPKRKIDSHYSFGHLSRRTRLGQTHSF